MKILLSCLAAACLALPAPSQPPAPKGTLVIMGGGDETPDIVAAVRDSAGGKGGVLGIVPTANDNPVRSLKVWSEVFAKAGLAIVPLDVRAREDSSRPAMLEAARKCTAFWFAGGDQVRIAEKIVGTPLQKLIQEKYREGAGVGGSSAGAAMMSRIMLEGEDRFGKLSLAEFGPGSYRTREGMAFLPDHVIVDQHFLRRGRQNRLFSLVMEHPDHLAIGIDENTALVVKDGRATVAGERAVMVFDAQAMQLKGASFRNLAIHLLRAGESIDLTTRKLQP